MRTQLHTDPLSNAAGCSRRKALHRLAGAGSAAGLAAELPGCGGGYSPVPMESAQDAVEPQAEALPAARTLRSGLDYPWSLDFLPDKSMLVTERVGRLRRVSADGIRSSTVSGIPTARIQNAGHGGLLDVAVDTEGADIWVYLSYAERGLHGPVDGLMCNVDTAVPGISEQPAQRSGAQIGCDTRRAVHTPLEPAALQEGVR